MNKWRNDIQRHLDKKVEHKRNRQKNEQNPPIFLEVTGVCSHSDSDNANGKLKKVVSLRFRDTSPVQKGGTEGCRVF